MTLPLDLKNAAVPSDSCRELIYVQKHGGFSGSISSNAQRMPIRRGEMNETKLLDSRYNACNMFTTLRMQYLE